MHDATGGSGCSHGGGGRSYLPHPFPLKRVVREREAHAGGFQSLHDCKPHAHPERPCCPERAFMTYGEWWQAHQPPTAAPKPETSSQMFSTQFWPYGRRVTDVITTEEPRNFELDTRVVSGAVPYKPRREATPSRTTPGGERLIRRTSSVGELLGSRFEADSHHSRNLTRAHSNARINTVYGPPHGHELANGAALREEHYAAAAARERTTPSSSAPSSYRSATTRRAAACGPFPEWRMPSGSGQGGQGGQCGQGGRGQGGSGGEAQGRGC